jgi:hypothetical protein
MRSNLYLDARERAETVSGDANNLTDMTRLNGLRSYEHSSANWCKRSA